MNYFYFNFGGIFLGLFLFFSSTAVWAQVSSLGARASSEKVLEIGLTDLQNSIELAKEKNAERTSNNEILRNKLLRLQKTVTSLQEERNKLLSAINQMKAVGTQAEKDKVSLDQQQVVLKKMFDLKKEQLEKIQKAVEIMHQENNLSSVNRSHQPTVTEVGNK